MSSNQRCKTHKYKRFSENNKRRRHDIYYCINCSSYKPVNMITGTHTLCWKCGQEFIMGDHSPLKPTCEDCRTKNTRITPEINVKELVDKLLGKI